MLGTLYIFTLRSKWIFIKHFTCPYDLLIAFANSLGSGQTRLDLIWIQTVNFENRTAYKIYQHSKSNVFSEVVDHRQGCCMETRQNLHSVVGSDHKWSSLGYGYLLSCTARSLNVSQVHNYLHSTLWSSSRDKILS